MGKTIAVCGKGGVGKTSFSALMVKTLLETGGRSILAIDADPASGLAMALGLSPKKSVNDIRMGMISGLRQAQPLDKSATMAQLDYEVFDALAQHQNLALLAVGRPEDEGCFCKLNALLKEIIQDLAEKFDIVIIDGEAGVEQINRRVMKTVDTLILVSDTSAKGVNVVRTITHLARDNRAVEYKDIGLVLNRVRHERETEQILSGLPIRLLGSLPEDDMIHDFDFSGRSFLGFPATSPTGVAVAALLENLL